MFAMQEVPLIFASKNQRNGAWPLVIEKGEAPALTSEMHPIPLTTNS